MWEDWDHPYGVDDGSIYTQENVANRSIRATDLIRCDACDLEDFLERTGSKVEDCVNLEALNCKLHRNEQRILNDLPRCRSLKYLNFWDDGSIRNFDFLSECVGLEGLVIDMGWSFQKIPESSTFLPKGKGKGARRRTQVMRSGSYNTLHFLRPLVNLRHLYVAMWANNELVVCDDLSPLWGLVNLEELDVRAVYVDHVDDIKNCAQLKRLWFHSHKQIDNIKGLRNLTNLRELRVCSEKTCSFDLAPLEELTKLKILHVPSKQQWTTSSIRRQLYDNRVEVSWGSHSKGTKRKVMA